MKTSALISLKTIIISLLFLQPVYARDFATVELKTIHVRGNIYMLEGIHGFPVAILVFQLVMMAS